MRHVSRLAARLGLTLAGDPIELSFVTHPRSHRGKLRTGGTQGYEIHGASFIRERRIVLDTRLRNGSEFDRILIHELYHFAWVRLGNPLRLDYERLLLAESDRRARGELGWSAESRKIAISPADRAQRTRAWREYVCESFCDTAAWLLGKWETHDEFTLPVKCRERRRKWFVKNDLIERISV